MSKTVTPAKQHQLMFKMEKYFFWFVALRENEKYFIKKYFNNRSKEDISILDAGCGAGYFVKELKDIGYNTRGFDYSDSAIKLSLQRGLELNKDIFQMDIFDLKFEQESFDCIILNDVLFAFTLDEAEIVMKNLKKLLKKDGILIGQTATFNWLYSQNDVVAGTKYRYNKKEIKELLVNNGLKIEKLSYRNFILFIPLVLKRLTSGKVTSAKNSKSELKDINMFLNKVLNFIFRVENIFLRYMNFFIGGTIFWIGRK